MNRDRSATVFLFDDELHARAHQYRLPGVDLHVFEHADEALRLVKQRCPQIVLMDYSMRGEQSGAEAMAALHHYRKSSGVLLHLVGISRSSDSNRYLLAAGADDAIPKTHVRGYLQRIVERMLLAEAGKPL